MTAPVLTLAPVLGLACNTLVHVVVSRVRNGRKPMVCLVVGAVIGLVVAMAISVSLLRENLRDLDSLAVLLMNLSTYLALAYGYFHFVNLNLASLRIRLLSEIGGAPGGLPVEAVTARYSAASVINARVLRLTEAKHLVVCDGRYYLGSSKIFLLLFEIFELMKYVVLGRGNRLLAAAGVARDVHPVIALAHFFWHDRFCRFMAVGGLNTAFGYTLYAFLVLLGLGFRLTLTILMVITILFNFITYGRLVFGDRRKRLLVRFVCVYGLIYVVNERSLTWLVHHGVGPLLAQALLLPVIVTASYLFNKAWVFQTRWKE